ncbi:MAG: ABC transporter ATP-binding protein [Hyphomicrobiaceae bacterium]
MSISVKNLIKIYGTNKVVDGVSFEVAKGEFVSLLGPSGCGKTTTLRCIAGLEEANGGEVAITGEMVSAPERNVMLPPNARDVGMVFQSYAVWPHMTVAENVAFPLKIRKTEVKTMADRVDWALGIVGLKALSERTPSQLSGGQQQRVALARAIVGRPRVLLFDEPLSNLDAKLRDTTRAEIRRLQKELNIAALYVTHDQAEALSMSDRVIVMDKGVIQQAGAPKELYRRPINKFVADFVGVASFIDVTPTGAADTWKLPDGSTIKADSSAAQAGKQHQLMLRPEAVGLAPIGTPFQGDDVQALKGRIVEASYLGAYSEYLIEAGGSLIRVHAGEDLAPGSEVAMAFRTVDARIVLV